MWTKRLGLVHTRLRIIDTSAAGTQPMANEDRTVRTVFNGEIYCHRSLREELELPFAGNVPRCHLQRAGNVIQLGVSGGLELHKNGELTADQMRLLERYSPEFRERYIETHGTG